MCPGWYENRKKQAERKGDICSHLAFHLTNVRFVGDASWAVRVSYAANGAPRQALICGHWLATSNPIFVIFQ